MSEKKVVIETKTELKSCPFCSSTNIKCEQMEQDNKIKVWVCWCGNCGSMGPVGLNWSKAIEMWNLRRSQKQLLDVLEIIQSIVKDPVHRTQRTQIQICRFFDELILPTIDTALAQVKEE